jgi:hypothetical protein
MIENGIRCDCGLELDQCDSKEPSCHHEVQDESSSAWQDLLILIEHARLAKSEEFVPFRYMDRDERRSIVTLPDAIGTLTHVKHLQIYGSSISRIPVAIAGMQSLEEFTPYTSYRLHWFPYEITRCRLLKSSTISTRALYGNEKYRPSFPSLHGNPVPFADSKCSICGVEAIPSLGLEQYWVSLLVATDVMPLLVRVCSRACLKQIPTSPPGYIQGPHKGGVSVRQPEVNA